MPDRHTGTAATNFHGERDILASLWGSGYTIAQRLLIALNIGTLGFFWWRRRTDLARYYETLRDLETGDELLVERSPPLAVQWGEHLVVKQRELSRVMTCLAMLPTDTEHPANEALAHYLRGLALIAKTDVHLQLEKNIAEEFHLALRGGMQAFGDWDGVEPFVQRFEEFASRFFTDVEDRPAYLGAVELLETDRLPDVRLRFDQAVMMKGLTDVYFVEKFDYLARERAAAERMNEGC